jgi:hypothetical protein
MEIWRYGDMKIWRYGDMKIERNRDTADFMYMVLRVTLVQRRLSIYPQVHRWLWVPFSWNPQYGDMEIWRYGDMEIIICLSLLDPFKSELWSHLKVILTHMYL